MPDSHSPSRRSFLRSAVATTMLAPVLSGTALAVDTHEQEAAAAGADAMVLGRITLDRELADQQGGVSGTLRFLRAVNGPVVVRWIDSFGRVAGEQTVSPTAPGRVAAPFSFNMRPGLAYVNWIRVTVNGVPQAATAKFMFSPAWTAWNDYHTISWAHYPDGFYDQLRETGLDAAIAYTKGNFTPVLDNNFRFYVEQMAWEVFSIYHKDEVEWRELMARISRDRGNLKLWTRSPCVNDPKTTEYLQKYLPQYVRRHRAFRPLFYNIADELGQGDQIQANDFCHSKFCTDKFAEYLRERYKQPAAVHREWQTGLEMTHWDDSILQAVPDWYKHSTMIAQTTTDRAFESIARSHFSTKYKSIEEFNRQWGTAFPAPRGEGPSAQEAWDPILAVVRDTASAPEMNAASLEKLVGPLEQANKRWGSLAGWAAPNKPTQFKNWDQVVAFVQRYYKELGEVTSTEGWNVSPWCDFRNFMDGTFADAIHRAGEICKAEDPHALWGTEGGQIPFAYGWYNYENVVRAVDVIEPYSAGQNVEIIRSLNPAVIMMSTHDFAHTAGQPLTAKDGTEQKRKVRPIWWGVFHNHRAALIWDNNTPGIEFVDMKTGKVTVSGETFAPTFHELRAGIGKLFIHARRKQDGIAIHYSQPTIQIEWLLSNLKHAREWMLMGASGGDNNLGFAVRNSWSKLIEDLGLQYNFVGSEIIRNGGLNSGEYKVFIMPESIAVSPEEVEQIRAFVQAGGTLIADWRIAELNGLGRDLGNGGQLNDVFGIQRGPGGNASKTVDGVANEGPLHLAGQELRELRVGDPTVTLNGGKALAKSGDVPMVIVNRFGSGQAIFLNMEIADYGYHRLQPGSRSSLPELMESTFAMGGVRPRIRVLGPDGKRLPGVEIVRFANGGCEHVAMFRNPQTDNSGWGAYPKLLASDSEVVLDPKLIENIDNSLLEKDAEITIEWPENRETYDVRGQKSLGKLQTQKATLRWWEPLVFTRSDNPLPALNAAVAPNARRGEMTEISLNNAGPLPGGALRVVRLEFTMPSGKPYELYARNAMFKTSPHVERIPFAVNDPKGKWKVSAHDLISGQTVETSFTLT